MNDIEPEVHEIEGGEARPIRARMVASVGGEGR